MQLRLGGESCTITESSKEAAERAAERIKAEYRVTTIRKEKSLRKVYGYGR